MREHLDLLVPALAAADIDAVLLGRTANARWVTGADTLWLSGTRPFAPGCVVVREPVGVHLLSATDDGVPDDVVPFDHLIPISWNPANLMGALAAVPGLPGARRIGVDSMTPMMAQLLAATFPDAELVDAERVLREVRRVKAPSDLAGIRAALDLAQECLAAVMSAAVPGVTERGLVGIYDEQMAGRGVSTPAFEGSFVAAGGRPRSLVSDRPLERGDLVHFRAGVLRNGWEGWLARSTVCGEGPSGRQHAGFDHWERAMATLVDECEPGTRVGDLRGSGAAVDGVGMGHEELSDADVLEPRMVISVELDVDGVLGSETVLITPWGRELLTTLASSQRGNGARAVRDR
ncbi:MAG: Xaa-Pro dipeptidase [Actinomycetota bacterium]|nr:Xaa-Pro dipeptidase [Actinomycetota bacterium]